ncbi:MAG: hypothetical protein WBF62_03805, partial [Bradyrhizobium sp.]
MAKLKTDFFGGKPRPTHCFQTQSATMHASQFASASPDTDAGSIAQQHLHAGLQLFRDGKAVEAIAAFQRGPTEAEKAGTESAETMSD